MKTPTSPTNNRSLTTFIVMTIFAVSTTSCSRLGTMDKMGIIIATGGTAGTIMQYQAQASAAAGIGGSALGGLLPAAAAMVTDSVPATAEQSRRAEIVGREYVAKLTPAKRQYFKQQKIKHVAVKTKSTSNTRGDQVMIYDIQSNKLASKTTFDVRVEPEVGSKIKFDTYVTEYVGNGEMVDPPSPTGALGKIVPKPKAE